MTTVHSATIYFDNQEATSLATVYILRVKELQADPTTDQAEIIRAEAMAGMFLNYLPITMQNDFRELIERSADCPHTAIAHEAADNAITQSLAEMNRDRQL